MPVEVSSGDSRGGGEEDKEEEERDSEAATEGTGETYPRCRASILRTLPDYDAAGAVREEEDSPMIPKKDRSALISQRATPAQAPPEADSSPSGAPSSAPGPLEAAPRTKRLTGFKLGKRPPEFAAIDQ